MAPRRSSSVGTSDELLMPPEFKYRAPEGVVLRRATTGSVGYDLRYNLNSPSVCIEFGDVISLGTGVFFDEIPMDHYIDCRSKSGLAEKHGIHVVNSPGLIDPDYRGEMGVILGCMKRGEKYTISPGDRIAQLVIVEVPKIVRKHGFGSVLVDVEKRGFGGFGSTGR